MEGQPREESAEEDATGVSPDLQRLFEESSFGSPEAREAYTQPPPHLVTDIVNRVRSTIAVDIETYGTGRVSGGQHRQEALRQVIEAHLHRTLRPGVGEWRDVSSMPPAGQVINPAQLHSVWSLVNDLTVLADRDATQQRHATVEPLTSSSSTGSWWDPHPVDNPPNDADQTDEDIKTRLGQQAFDLAQEYLVTGKLDRARHWLTIAAEYDIQDAQILLADVAVIQDALDNPPAGMADSDTAGQERQPDLIDQVHEAAGLLRWAREQAQTIIRNAHNTAEDILDQARTETATHSRRESLTDYLTRTDLFASWMSPLSETRHEASVVAYKLRHELAKQLLQTHHTPSEHSKIVSRVATRLLLADARRDGPDDLMLLNSNCHRALDEMPLRTIFQAKSLAAAGGMDTALRLWDPVPGISGRAIIGPTDAARMSAMCVLVGAVGGGVVVAGFVDGTVRIWDQATLTSGGASLTGPRLWTPVSPDRANDDDPPTISAEQRLEPERIVPGQKFRQALDELNEQLAATGT